MSRLTNTAPRAMVMGWPGRSRVRWEETTLSSEPSSLPPAAGAPGAERLSSRALAYLNTRTTIELLVGAAMLVSAVVFVPHPGWRAAAWAVIGVSLVGALALELPWLNRRQVAFTSFTVTSEFVYIARGRVFRRTTMIATPQILNVESVQGPLARFFGVGFVRFTCLTDVEKLGPLAPDVVDDIRRTVLRSFAADG